MRRTVLQTLLVALLLVAPVSAAASAATTGHDGAGATPAAGLAAAAETALQDSPNPCVGTIERTPDRTTLFSIQGAHGGEKTSAMVVGARPDGSVVGVHNDTAAGRWWSYDVDVLPNGNILQPTTQSRHTVIEEIDPATGEHVSERHFRDTLDTHDVDLINGDELLVNDMSQDGEDRVFVYNLTREEVVWEYYFANYSEHYPESGGGEFGGDWTHNNDVEQIGDGTFMVSVRNFDKVVAIDRETKDVEWTLGADDNTTILHEQHNPDFIESEDGNATVLVADSLNDRVVEYEREGDSWNRTWVARGGGLDEPRDADRLPNGNTLIADRRAHRIVEVTPEGDVVWEMYSPYQPYDAERVGTGDESSRPTMADAAATGSVQVTGSADFDAADVEACYDFLTSVERTQLIPDDELDAVTESSATDGGNETDGGNGTDGESDSDTESGGNGDSVLGTPTTGSGPSPVGPVLALAGVAALFAGAVVRLRRR
ncbi:aryl-sulfate sulfotransferase [Halosimplex aquaticum]|uniref:Aryl-sulfate sulfotransferase n=1 Tax=Halosimplex aquaticum TaxID=3026162 RepID=A0ABD5Y950_9EURY|nr:aryl-sulfate sulfotransferase [Halosimplex aquaticum]